jgi:hypothetical protein
LQPPALACRQRFDTFDLGAGLLGAGATVSVASILFLAIPPLSSERRVDVIAPDKPPGLGLTLSF